MWTRRHRDEEELFVGIKGRAEFGKISVLLKRIKEGFDGSFVCMKENKFTCASRNFEESGFGFQDVVELLLPLKCVSLDQLGQILEEGAIQVKIIAALELRHGAEINIITKRLEMSSVQRESSDPLSLVTS